VHDLIVAGGAKDPSVARLIARAEARGRQVLPLLHSDDDVPAFAWDYVANTARVGRLPLKAKAAFIRHDVFSHAGQAPPRLDAAMAWYSALAGWCLAERAMRMFNRRLDQRAGHKPCMLVLAREAGLAVPHGIAANERGAVVALGHPDGLIAKPVAGGGYCQALADVIDAIPWRDDRAPLPALVQERLTYPEYRVYLIGERVLAFAIESAEIDYRREPGAAMRFLAPGGFDRDLGAQLHRLAAAVGVDFCACDLKTDPASGTPVFLELNTQPMFAAHDQVAEGAVADAILDHLDEGHSRTAVT